MARAISILFLLLSCFTTFSVTAQTLAGRTLVTIGDMTAEDSNGNLRPLNRRSEVFAGDIVSTSAESRGQLRMIDSAMLSMGCATSLAIEGYYFGDRVQNDQVSLRLLSGTLRTITGEVNTTDSDRYRFMFGENTLRTEDSDFEVVFDSGNQIAYIAVYNGSARVETPLGEFILGAGGNADFARVETGKEPELLASWPNPQVNVTSPVSQGNVLRPVQRDALQNSAPDAC